MRAMPLAPPAPGRPAQDAGYISSMGLSALHSAPPNPGLMMSWPKRSANGRCKRTRGRGHCPNWPLARLGASIPSIIWRGTTAPHSMTSLTYRSRFMVSQTLASYLVLDLDTLTTLYNSIYDEMDLPPGDRVRGAEIADACRAFLAAHDAKIPNDLR